VERAGIKQRSHKDCLDTAKAYIWKGTSDLSLFLAILQQDAFRLYESEAKASGTFDAVDRFFSRVDESGNGDQHTTRSMSSVGMMAVDLLMILLVKDDGITTAEANRRLNGSSASKRSQMRLNNAIGVLRGLAVINKQEVLGESHIEWSFHATRAKLPRLLRKWPSEETNNEGGDHPSRIFALLSKSSDQSEIPIGIVRELPSMVLHMLLYQSDHPDVVVRYRAKVSSSDENRMSKMITDDLWFWDSRCLSSKPIGLNIAFLHRLMRPLLLRMRSSNHEGTTVPDRGRVKVMSFSLLDVLLRCRLIQPYVVDGVLGRLLMLAEENAMNCDGFRSLLLEYLHGLASVSCAGQYIFQQLGGFLACFGGTIRDSLIDEAISVFSDFMDKDYLRAIFSRTCGICPSGPIETISIAPTVAMTSNLHGPTDTADGGYGELAAQSCWAQSKKAKRAVRTERLRLLKAFHKANEASLLCINDGADAPRRSNRQIVPRGRGKDGALIFSENELTLSEFIERRQLMELVNQSFTRSYVEGVSKPALAQLDLTADDIEQLQSIFFDDDGSLRDEMRLEIDSGMKNDPRYIVFANLECFKKRKDARWQVPSKCNSVRLCEIG
jgi:hypothetical protein